MSASHSLEFNQLWRRLLRKAYAKKLKVRRWPRRFQRKLFELFLGETFVSNAEYEHEVFTGSTLFSSGDFVGAQRCFRRALSIKRNLMGAGNPELVLDINRLVHTAIVQQHLILAEDLCREALSIQVNAFGAEALQTAEALTRLAQCLVRKGDYEETETLFRRVLEIRERTQGNAHRDVGGLLSEMATVKFLEGDLEEARKLFERSLSIMAAYDQGTGGPRTKEVLARLAGVHVRQGNVDGAELCARNALALTDASGEDVITAEIYAILSEVALGRNQANEAEHFARRALNLRARLLGNGHASTARAVADLAQVLASRGRVSDAVQLYKGSLRVDSNNIQDVLAAASERERIRYLASVRFSLDRFLTFAIQHRESFPELVSESYTAVLRRKGIGLQVNSAQRFAVLSGRYPELRLELGRLHELRTEIGRRLLAPSPAQEATIEELERNQESLERKLAQSISEVDFDRIIGSADSGQVTAAVPAGAVVLEFVRFKSTDRSPTAPASKGDGLVRYACFIVTSQKILLVDLGGADLIEKLVLELYASIARRDMRPSTRAVELDDSLIAQRATGEITLDLSEKLLSPILPSVENADRLIIAPDGALFALPFEALVTVEGGSVVDRYETQYITCGRELCGKPRTGGLAKTAPVVIADPAFDLAQPGDLPAHNSKGNFFRRLPESRSEGEAVAKLLGVTAVLGEAALKGKLKRIASPAILHLATHGFFFEAASSPNENERLVGRFGARLAGLMAVRNPLLRSGLALAGANDWLNGADLSNDVDTGLVTAEEVAMIDLSSTELVVLSACDTGRGDIQAGEGVLGLQYAFMLAGARNLIMSLWRVSDESTSMLMKLLYEALSTGKDPATSLRSARLEVRKKFPEAQFWAGFVYQGNSDKSGLA